MDMELLRGKRQLETAAKVITHRIHYMTRNILPKAHMPTQ
jgi:hypothetical protein